jgi:hypothetical protein
MVTTSEKGEDNWQQHQRMKQETGAASGKQGTTLRGPQINSWVWGQKVNSQVFDWAIGSEWLDTVEGSAPSEMKEETSKAQTLEKRDGSGTPGLFRTLSGNCSGQVALKRELQEQLQSKNRWNRVIGKEGEDNHRRHKHSPQKRRNGCMPVGYSGWIALRREHRGM